tara:strand:- start:11919 stop:12605 length:687 start_codon:yes stop_codon:yes gene_type:complete
MVLIDTVYQRVLALANKEQRGYITPQEFNLFANQAQLEILDQYVYDINLFNRIPGNDKEYSDMIRLLGEKIGILTTETTEVVSTGGIIVFPIDLYKLGNIFFNNSLVDQITSSEYRKLLNSPLTTPSLKRPVCVIFNNQINIYPQSIPEVLMSYVRVPNTVSWGYVVINNKALYDPNPTKTTNFELHASEETELVYKILKLSGVAIQRQELAQFASSMEQSLQQKEKQ